MSADRGLEVLTRYRVGGVEEDSLHVKLSFGFLLAGVITGAAVAIGSGAVNKWVWKERKR